MRSLSLEDFTPEQLDLVFQLREPYAPILQGAHGLTNRIWLLWHATYLDAFGQHPPYGPIPGPIVQRLARALGETLPAESRSPDRRQTFFTHAEKARRLLGFRKFSGRCLRELSSWLTEEARKNDDPGLLQRLLLEKLWNEKIIAPASYRIDRLVGSVRIAAQREMVGRILKSLTLRQIQLLDQLRELRPGTRNSALQWLKEPCGFSDPEVLLDLLARILFVREFGLSQAEVETIHPNLRRRTATLVQRYSIDSLFGDFPEDKRRAYLACYLHERLKALIDTAVECFDDVVQGVRRRSEKSMQKDLLAHGRAINEKLKMFETMAAILRDTAVPDAHVRATVYEKIPPEELDRALEECRAITRPADYNCFDYMRRRYSYVRRFFPRLLEVLVFEGTPEAEPLLQALQAVKEWNGKGTRGAPDGAPLAFVSDKWRTYVCPPDKPIDRRYYELCVLESLQAALQGGDVWAVGGRRYGNIEDLLIPREAWPAMSRQCYADIGLPEDPKIWLAERCETLRSVIQTTVEHLPENPQVFIENGRVHLKALEAQELPERLDKITEHLTASWPDMQLPELLLQVDGWLGLTELFRTLAGQRSRSADFTRSLLTTLVAEGCNLGLTKMAALTPTVSVRSIRRIREQYLYEDTLRTLLDALVKAQHRLPIANLLGDDTVSMSDGMRVATRVQTIRAGFLPAHMAPGDRGLTFYSHVLHQGPVLGCEVIGNERDATYVLDNLLHIQSELPIREHYTDTHGFTEVVFGLSDVVLKIDFCPRIKAMHDQDLYRPPGMKIKGPLAAHFGGTINTALIERHWDDLVRIFSSLRRKVTSAVLLCQRLSSHAKHNPLHKALLEVGRISKTIHILKCYDDPERRRRSSAGLNRIESYHTLARHLFYGRQGQNWERELEEQASRASCLAVLANVVILWNSVHLTTQLKALRAKGIEVLPEDFRHVSPYAYEHVLPYGQYVFDLRKRHNREAFVQAQKL